MAKARLSMVHFIAKLKHGAKTEIFNHSPKMNVAKAGLRVLHSIRQLKQTAKRKNETCPDSSVGCRDKTIGKQSHIERSRNVFKQSSTTLRLTRQTTKNKNN